MRALVLVLLMSFAVPGAARPLSTPESAALQSTMEAFIDAVVERDMATILDVMSPRVLNHIAELAGMNADDFRSMVAQQASEVVAAGNFRDFDYNVAGLDVADSVHPDGTAIAFGILPYSFTFEAQEQNVRITSQMVALREGSDWYLFRYEGPQSLQILKKLYPSLDDLQPVQSTTTILSE